MYRSFLYIITGFIILDGMPNLLSSSLNSNINGHEYVEMGDGLKWATCNVGASVPEEFGNYYSWGETSTKKDYRWETYKWMLDGKGEWNAITKYTIKDGITEGIWYEKSQTDSTRTDFVGDGLNSLIPKDDAATVNWGGTWRTPTFEEWSRLLNDNKFVWRWKKVNGVPGFKVTSRIKGYVGNSIFLPAAGGYEGGKPTMIGIGGYYWSSTLSRENSDGAYDLGFLNSPRARRKLIDLGPDFRLYGLSVRAVSD